MERQEPTLGKPAGLEEVEFRPRTYRGPTRPATNESDFWLKATVCLVALVVVAVGLIEWNARRQAAAMTAELMRPMTPAEKRELDRQVAQIDAEDARDLANLRRQIWQEAPQTEPYVPSPLKAGERCIEGRRLKRVSNGWTQVREPC
ncbi:hypothetical protein [Xanthomonas vesicatoria]|nr:hypothetical protein [Xanthomonas vesicatoria]MCC8558703.1 hypothetical protein [Xanthomonas vesicatoria]MCC8595648.1 hypothetical protein [Xanthomonas vesicatoria]MCC8603712.1 hypothetical protein [Xanthomonas vesicatoria]MCC8673281.1 hypothetical protein [Xanthomonas vesicatoria]MCC8678142.1 hypothetical protein [Xanthomonas vesicatoria]